MRKKSGIYKIVSKINPSKIYIGSSVDIGARKDLHLSRLRRNVHINKKMQNHTNKYGLDDLVFSVIYECEKDNLILKEQYYIDLYSPWFNIRKIAKSNLGIKYSKEVRRRFSEAKKKCKTLSEWGKGHIPWNKGITSPLKGKRLSEEAKLNMKNGWLKRLPMTEETRQRMREGQAKRFKNKKLCAQVA